MTYPDYIRSVLARALDSRASLSLACLFLLCPAASYGRQVTPTPRAPRPAPVVPAQAPAAPARPAAPAPPARPAAPPREVVTVVHRLSGWKLLAWLATSGPPALVLEELPTLSDSHTNIVAGYVYGNGRNVVARLPQAEVEWEAFGAPQAPPSFFAQAGNQFKAEPEYTLVTSEGRRVEAKLVGLDSSTGLALLEAGESLLPAGPTGDEGDTNDPTVGQRVHLYAPILTEAPPAPAARPAPPAPPAPTESGDIYVGIDQKEGRLTRLFRTPSGRLSSVAVSARVSPEWDGAVAANELGEVVGIVSQSREGETRVLPMMAVREACERVLKLRGTVPQPWFGARGDAAAQAPLKFWKDFGWTQETARSFIVKQQGVILTSVAPGTPAALAGLRPGDLITSVGPRDVRSNEDFSMTLKEAGVGSVVDLTVWRALAPEPLKLSVELKGVKNPALATAEAEERGLLASLNVSEREIQEMRATEARLKAQSAAHTAEFANLARRIAIAQGRAARLRLQLEQTRERLGGVNLFFSLQSAPVLYPQGPERRNDLTRRLKTYGLHAIGLSKRSAAPLGAQGGLLVIAVQPESHAAASGLLAGDVIETVNGSPLWRVELRRLTSAEASTAVLGLVRGGKRLSVNFPPAPAAEQRRR